MKGIISSHSALTAYQRQTSIDSVSNRASAVSDSGTVSAGGSVGAARVSISAEARAMAGGQGVDEGGAIDRAKVEQLREALRSGRLKFDSALVAQRMIDQGE